MKFFQRNPLSNGIIRVGFSAVREIIQWMWALVLSHLSFASKARIGTVMQQ
jgi:hypothetical protein